MKSDKIATTIRIDINTWDKFKVIASINRRSTNAELEYIITTIVKSYENENGTIELDYDDTLDNN